MLICSHLPSLPPSTNPMSGAADPVSDGFGELWCKSGEESDSVWMGMVGLSIVFFG